MAYDGDVTGVEVMARAAEEGLGMSRLRAVCALVAGLLGAFGSSCGDGSGGSASGQDCASICNQIATECSGTTAECILECEDTQTDAEADGCASQWQELARCCADLSYRGACANGEDVDFRRCEDSCGTPSDDLQACESGDDTASGAGGSSGSSGSGGSSGAGGSSGSSGSGGAGGSSGSSGSSGSGGTGGTGGSAGSPPPQLTGCEDQGPDDFTFDGGSCGWETPRVGICTEKLVDGFYYIYGCNQKSCTFQLGQKCDCKDGTPSKCSRGQCGFCNLQP